MPSTQGHRFARRQASPLAARHVTPVSTLAVAALRDKRVDKMLQSIGRTHATVYYSPISIWLILLMYFLPASFFIIHFLTSIGQGWLLLAYGILSYLINGYHNNSFALQDRDLIAINPNYPFRRLSVISIDDIEQVEIDRGDRKWKYLFLLFEDNYLSIKTKNTTYKFYCSGLEMDGFDEGSTEKTIEDLDNDLKQKGISTRMKIQ